MSRIAIVTDSSVCLPTTLVETLDIRVLPITVHLPGSDRLDGGNDLPHRVYQALEADQPVKSSPPSVAEYLAAVEEADADAVVVVTPATELSAMGHHASLACRLASRRAVTVDSRTGAAGQGLVALAGARTATEEGSLDAVLRSLEEASNRVDQVGSLAVLAPLRRSGRVPSTVLDQPGGGARSVFRMRRGAVESLANVPSPDAALDQVQAAWEQGGGPEAAASVIFHGGVPELADQLGRRLGGRAWLAPFSAAMGIYTGPGVVGVAWVTQP